MVSHVPDPYEALKLPHTATIADIKRSYRDLARQYHPDRLTQKSQAEQDAASKCFAAISSAYALLMDPQRKAQYDHIYKYGGFDDADEEDDEPVYYAHFSQTHPQQAPQPLRCNKPSKPSSVSDFPRKRRKSVGVGYSCTDPLAFMWNSENILSTKKVAGVQIPSRFQMGQPGGGFAVSISAGEFRYDGDTRQYTSRTTQFAHGKKATKTETTTIHRDGTKEILIQGDDFVEKRTTTVQDMSSHEDFLPWYLNAWLGLKDKLAMCYYPSADVHQ